MAQALEGNALDANADPQRMSKRDKDGALFVALCLLETIAIEKIAFEYLRGPIY